MAGLRDALRALKGIRAFHGSPHDFERFSLDAIGTGEGAQAYGHGLYFAENEAVARGYRDQISKDWRRTGTGDLFAPSSLEHLNVRVRATNGELDNAIETARSVLAREDMPEATRAMARRDLARLEEIQASGGLEPHQGHMYEVNIDAAPEEFLDWDAPIYRQSETVLNGLRSLGAETERRSRYSVAPSATGRRWTVRNVWGDAVGSYKTREAADAAAEAGSDSFNKGGGMLAYTNVGGNSAYPHLDKGAASQRLRDVGIRGIRYLDQGSRAAGSGSRNYTVFDDSLVNIVRKYAVPGAIGLGSGGLTLREALADRMT